MANCMIGFPNNFDAATLSGGSFTAGMPLSRLKTRKLKDVARTTNTAKTSTFINIDQGAMRGTRALALVNHNFSVAAKYRVRASNEAAATNCHRSSQNIMVAPWTPNGSAGWVVAPVTDPNGGTTAQLITPTGGGTKFDSMPDGLAAGGQYTVSRYFKMSGTETRAHLYVDGMGGPYCEVTYDLQAGVLLNLTGFTSYKVTPAGNGFSRLEATFSLPLDKTSCSVHTYPFGQIIEAWSQLELGSKATSYIPTTNARVTRPAGFMDDWQSYDYDSGWLDVWPVVYPFGSKAWEDPNWWGGKYAQDELAGYTSTKTHLLPGPMLHRYWRIDIDDTTNPAGFLQLGRVFIGPAWQPRINMARGASIGLETDTEVQKSQGGNESFDPRTPYRVHRYKLEGMTRDEALANAFELQRRAGVDKEILWLEDPDDTVHALRTQYLARLRSLSPIEYPYWQDNTTAFEIKELQ